MSTSDHYYSFLVRLWRDDSRFVVETERIPDGDRRFFASVNEFVRFLHSLEARFSTAEPKTGQAGCTDD